MAEKTTMKGIVRSLSGSCGLRTSEVLEAIEALLESMRRTLAAGGRIEIRGLGTFRTRFRKERWARDIRRAKKVFVPAHAAAVFVAGIKLKKELNSPGPDREPAAGNGQE